MIRYLSPTFIKPKIPSSGGLGLAEVQALINANKALGFLSAHSSAYGVSVVHDSSGIPLLSSDGSTLVAKEPLKIELVVDSTGEPIGVYS